MQLWMRGARLRHSRLVEGAKEARGWLLLAQHHGVLLVARPRAQLALVHVAAPVAVLGLLLVPQVLVQAPVRLHVVRRALVGGLIAEQAAPRCPGLGHGVGVEQVRVVVGDELRIEEATHGVGLVLAVAEAAVAEESADARVLDELVLGLARHAHGRCGRRHGRGDRRGRRRGSVAHGRGLLPHADQVVAALARLRRVHRALGGRRHGGARRLALGGVLGGGAQQREAAVGPGRHHEAHGLVPGELPEDGHELLRGVGGVGRDTVGELAERVRGHVGGVGSDGQVHDAEAPDEQPPLVLRAPLALRWCHGGRGCGDLHGRGRGGMHRGSGAGDVGGARRGPGGGDGRG
mmetsp:Transcript_8756/g.29905  ORF Transcript_8756/g.29905 Transcript_8756/m.29905 type:complete len:348 (-) Transcript_8756:88-1131(-)